MALISPGVQVQVIDESQYAPTVSGSIPYVLVASAQDKQSPSGSIAIGTTKINSGKVSLVTSQRELVNLFGTPQFKTTQAGTPIHGSEQNEYGLMTAFNLLGITSRVYVQRADVDLSQLEPSVVRPRSLPANGTYWFNVEQTSWGIFEWNLSTQSFEEVRPILITDSSILQSGLPPTSLGNIGSYAIVTTNRSNPVYYKKYDNTWVLVGSTAWQSAHPAVQSTTFNPILSPGSIISINGTDIMLTGTSVINLANDINVAGISGLSARAFQGKLEIFIDSNASSDSSTLDGLAIISDVSGSTLQILGIQPGTFRSPSLQISSHTQVPRWRQIDGGRPTGSVWCKTTSPSGGANFVLSQFSILSSSFVSVTAPLYSNDQTAIRFLDPVNGGINIGQDSVYVQTDVLGNNTLTYKLLKRNVAGLTTDVVGSINNPVFVAGSSFAIRSSLTGVTALSEETVVVVSGTTASDFVASILQANIPNITAQVTVSGGVRISHTKGGVFYLRPVTGNPLAAAGITVSNDNVRAGTLSAELVVSSFGIFDYEATTEEPNSDPADGTMWYYADVSDIDIMVHDGSSWKGYQNVSLDARGFNLTQTNPTGPIVSASQPLSQVDGTPLVLGDLWIDTSDLENFPLIKRYSLVNGQMIWTNIDNTDQTSENGIVFADVRWDSSGTQNPVADDMPDISSLLVSDYVDLDAPEPELYPRGILLFNTRRSGFNVKRFVRDYFNEDRFEGALPQVKNTWVSVAGNKENGSPFMGRQAVRKVVTNALKAAITASEELREEQRNFTLIACPGYPELIPNMIALNNDRRNKSFVVGDTPLRLPANASAVQRWANDESKQGTGEFGLSVSDPYAAVYYPAALTTDLSGNNIVMPASYMALRAIIRSDGVSYPWIAAAGTRRGIVDNANAVGYIDSQTGEFVQVGLNEGMRDTLYENKINPIPFMIGSGLIVYGNKTIGVPNTALDRINVSRLVIYLRTVLDLLSRNFVFEPNDKITRDEFKQSVEKVMIDLVSKRAITDFLVVCDESNNTPARRDRNEMYLDVAIEPVKSAEFIYVPIRIKAQGAISGS